AELLGFLEERNGAFEPDVEHVLVLGDRLELAVVAHVRSETADGRIHLLAGLRMRPQVARKLQQLDRGFERDRIGGDVLRDGHALGLLVAFGLPELDVRPVRALQQLYQLPRRDIDADLALGGFAALRTIDVARVVALRIAGTADKSPAPAESQRE